MPLPWAARGSVTWTWPFIRFLRARAQGTYCVSARRCMCWSELEKIWPLTQKLHQGEDRHDNRPGQLASVDAGTEVGTGPAGHRQGRRQGRKWEKLRAEELDQRFLGIKDKKEP